jgi:hypothetical protein
MAVDRRARAPRRKVKSAASGTESAHPPNMNQAAAPRAYRMHARIDDGQVKLYVMALDAERLHPPADQGVCIAQNFLNRSSGVLHSPILARSGA